MVKALMLSGQWWYWKRKWNRIRKAKWKWRVKIKKRDEMADKNGKVNEKSKWKNW